jgi:hypothetical protein
LLRLRGVLNLSTAERSSTLSVDPETVGKNDEIALEDIEGG